MPSKLAGLIAKNRGEVRAGPWCDSPARPSGGALLWSFPLWLSIAAGHLGGRRGLPVSLSVHRFVPAHRAADHRRRRADAGRDRRVSRSLSHRRDMFYGAPQEAAVGAAIVLHLFSFGPALLLGLAFAAEEGLNMSAMRRLADQEQGHTA
jgi:hypothetical protein